ncbi:MAG: peptidoglycan DD-metalloendopeptidase family protein [Kofleriaceae bacterium]
MKIDGTGARPLDPVADKAAKADGVKTAAKQLEAFFLRTMLAESHTQGGGAMDGGFAGDTFKSMLDEAIADKMSAGGGIGMSQMFSKQLGGTPETAAAAPTALHGPPSIAEVLPEGVPHFVLPVTGRASSGYGLRADPITGGTINHPGFDLAAATGTQVSAAARGTITHAGPAGTYGNLVTVRHEHGFETRYAHLSAVDVQVGDVVEAGQDVGKVGTTGYSTGPHLHFEVRQDGQPIDPAPLLPLNRSLGRTTR